MRTLLLALACVLAVLPAAAQEQYYRSDEMGLLLAPIPAALRDDSRFVARVTRSGADEDKRLYDNGKEIRRWQTSWNADHSRKTELESANGSLSARRLFDAGGSLLSEETYTAGVMSSRTQYSYVAGRLATRRQLDADGKETARDTYVYADNGSLREVRRSTPGGPADVSSAVAGWSGLSEQRTSAGGLVLAERYDVNGRLLQRQRKTAAGVTTVEEFSYDAKSGKLAASREQGSDGFLAERLYDASGLLSQETITLKGRAASTTTYQRDDKGRVTTKTTRSPAGVESWHDTYSDSGSLDREEYFKRGVRVKVTLYGEDQKRTEELYRGDGELFLKVYYDGEQRRREEVYAGGEMVHARDFP